MAKFEERLRSLRLSKGLSQMDLAKLLKISKSSVNMYERGEREPGIETLEKIADLFNVDLDYLLGKSDHTSRAILSTGREVSSEEYSLILKYRKLDERGKAAVLNVLNHEYESLPGEKARTTPKEA